jgi:hypothetical protein
MKFAADLSSVENPVFRGFMVGTKPPHTFFVAPLVDLPAQPNNSELSNRVFDRFAGLD